ncbi:hypothetical protein DFH28DRAFT_1130417 [Melampsora americana]|nr:hypothetical protein DFH28DRAFT_1130417 [Melampsora americana]
MSGILKKPPATIKKGSGSAEHADQPQHHETDILIDRFLEYKSITKGLTAYYEDISKLETHTATELQRIGGHLPVPLREGNQFLPEGGWQSILYGTRERTRAIAEHHSTFAHAISSTVVHALLRTKTEIKNFIAELEAEPSRIATEVGKHRAESTKLISQLALGIANAKSNPHALTSKDDPVLTHRQVETQLKAQLAEENSLTRSVIIYQKKAAELESRINKDIQTATNEFHTAQVTSQEAIAKEWKLIHSGITELDPEIEWNEFAKRSGHLIPEDIAMRDPEKITFPGQDDETTKPVKSGLLERKKRYTKNYKEGFYVLTPSGYLHEHKSSDPTKHSEPEMSIFLPNCVLGATSPEGAKSFKWHVEGKKNSSSGHHTGSLNKVKNTLRIGKKDIAFSFKARTHAEMMDWWNLMQHPAKASFTAATVKSSLPEGAAVAAVSGVGLVTDKSNAEHEPATVTHREAEDTADEEVGGSSEEEETPLSPDELSTAPTTPAGVHTVNPHSDHTHGEHETEHSNAEVLPVYKGTGTHEAALADLKEKPDLPGANHNVASTSH